MKPFFFALIVLSISTISKINYAQNLVPNHSFEEYDSCPDFVSQLNRATHWFQPTLGTPDYFNACFTPNPYPNADVPYNVAGVQFAKDGNAYGGAFMYFCALITYREYLEVKLVQPLTAGTLYYVILYTSLSDSSLYATDRIGVYLSPDSIYSSNFDVFPFQPQVENSYGNFIVDTMLWTKVQGSYIAKGGERFIVIGNFYDQNHTDTIRVQPIGDPLFGPHGYYYIDDVCVTTDTTTCQFGVGIETIKVLQSNISPNLTSTTLQIIHLSSIHPTTLTIFNLLGEIVKEERVNTSEVTIDVSELPAGMYVVKTEREMVGKFVKE